MTCHKEFSCISLYLLAVCYKIDRYIYIIDIRYDFDGEENEIG